MTKLYIWNIITSIGSILAVIVAIIGLFLAWNTASQANAISSKALDLQYTPQIAIQIISDRIPTCLTGTNYSQCDYFEIFRNDFVQQQGANGIIATIPEASWAEPINITFYNLGNVGTRLEKIRYSFSCDPAGERDWQVDIMKNRILLPSQQISYSNYLHLNFLAIPNQNEWCSINFKFIFFNNYTQTLTYRVWYQNYNNTYIVPIERQEYLKTHQN